MPCIDENTVVALIEGRLAKDSTAAVHAHTSECPACRRLVAALARSEGISEAEVTRATVDHRGVAFADTHVSGEELQAGIDLVAGHKLGRYSIIEKLGAGGMGSVYLANDAELDRRVAIKILHSGTVAGAERLLREARAMAKLRHPNVVTVFEVSRDQDDVFVVMEFIEGETLRDWLGGDRSVDDKITVLRQAAEGLAAAHAKGLVHRDFKPDNVMIGDHERVQVLDFGLAKPVVSARDPQPIAMANTHHDIDLTQTGALVGTPAYMAPEQFAHAETDERTDQFAFCVVAFEALHGERPYNGETLVELADSVATGDISATQRTSSVPASIASSIERGLEASPDARFESMQPLIRVLRRREVKRRWMAPVGLGVAVLAASAAWVVSSQASQAVLLAGTPTSHEAIMSTSALPDELPTPLENDPLGVTIHRLANGLTVYISPNRKRPRVNWTLIVRAGSRDNPPAASGLSHLVEHMAYAGSSRLGAIDFEAESFHLARLRELYARIAAATTDAERSELVEKIDDENVEASKYSIPNEFLVTAELLGAVGTNGFTDRDLSVFSADVPSQKFATWASLEAERLVDPVFRLFHSETAAVHNEKRTRDSAQGWQRRATEAIYAGVFADHPYSADPLGSYTDLLAEQFIELEDFYASWFVPNNAALVLVGDVDPSVAVPILERELGHWQPRPLPSRSSTPVQALTGEQKRIVHSDGARYAFVSWLVPIAHPSTGRLIESAAAVMRERASMLTERGEPSIPRFEGAVLENADAATAYFWIVPASEQSLAEAISVFDSLLGSLKRGDFDSESIESAALNQQRLLKRSLEGDEVRSTLLTQAFRTGKPWSAFVDNLVRDRVSKAEVVAFANETFGSARVVVEVEPGKVELAAPPANLVTPLKSPIGEASDFSTALLAVESVEQPLRFVWRGRDYDFQDTRSGRVIAVGNRDNGLYSLTMRWEFGFESAPLACYAVWALGEEGGLASVSAAERKRRWHARGLEVKPVCSGSGIEISMEGFDASFDTDLAEVRDWLSGDGLRGANWARFLKLYIGRWRSNYAESPLFHLGHYAATGSMYPWMTTYTLAELEASNLGDAKDALRLLGDSKRTSLYFGPRTLASLNLENVADKPPPLVRPRRFLRSGRPRVVLLDKAQGQAAETIIYVGIGPISEQRMAVAELFASVASEAISDVLRKRLGASFGVEVQFRAPARRDDEAGYTIRFSTEAEHVAKAIDLTLAKLRDVPMAGLGQAKRRTSARYRGSWIRPRDLAATVADWLQRGLEADPRPIRYTQLGLLGPSRLEEFSARVSNGTVAIAISGGLKRLDRKQLAAQGRLLELRSGDVRTITTP